VLLSSFFFTSISGQVTYSTQQNYLNCKTEQNNLLTPFFNAYPDTSIQELSQYMPRNFMGNTGLPSPLYLLRLQSNNLGFRLYEIPYANDRFSDNQVEYHTALGPYASLQGIAGDKQLQMFRLFFTNTYYKRLNISLRFNRNTSLGFYKKQQTFTNNFYFSAPSV